MQDEIEKAFKELNIFHVKSKTNHEARMADPCESIRINCIASVAAEAAIMHFGCAALDLTVIAGAICHGAALTYQYTAGNTCNLEAEKCRKAQ